MISVSEDAGNSFLAQELWRPVAAILVLGAGLVVIYATPLRDYLRHIGVVRARLEAVGPAAPLLFTIGTAALVAIGCPRLLLCAVGGAAFGFWKGLLFSQVGTVAGAYATFLFVRWGGGDFVRRHWPRIERLRRAFHHGGWLAVAAVRQLPVGGVVVNSVLGLTPVRHSDFLSGTIIGNLPEAVPVTLLGGGAVFLTGGRRLAVWLAGLLVVVAIWVAAVILVRRAVLAEDREEFEELERLTIEKGTVADDKIEQ